MGPQGSTLAGFVQNATCPFSFSPYLYQTKIEKTSTRMGRLLSLPDSILEAIPAIWKGLGTTCKRLQTIAGCADLVAVCTLCHTAE